MSTDKLNELGFQYQQPIEEAISDVETSLKEHGGLAWGKWMVYWLYAYTTYYCKFYEKKLCSIITSSFHKLNIWSFFKRFIKHYIEMNELFLFLALSSMSLVDLMLDIFMQKGLFSSWHIFGQEVSHQEICCNIVIYFLFCNIISYSIIRLKFQWYLGYFNLGYFVSIIIVFW